MDPNRVIKVGITPTDASEPSLHQPRGAPNSPENAMLRWDVERETFLVLASDDPSLMAVEFTNPKPASYPTAEHLLAKLMRHDRLVLHGYDKLMAYDAQISQSFGDPEIVGDLPRGRITLQTPKNRTSLILDLPPDARHWASLDRTATDHQKARSAVAILALGTPIQVSQSHALGEVDELSSQLAKAGFPCSADIRFNARGLQEWVASEGEAPNSTFAPQVAAGPPIRHVRRQPASVGVTL